MQSDAARPIVYVDSQIGGRPAMSCTGFASHRLIRIFTSGLMIGTLAIAAVGGPNPVGADLSCDGYAPTIYGSGQLNGTAGDDVIIGSNSADLIFGNGGDDIICGRGGADEIHGGDGEDEIDGGTISMCSMEMPTTTISMAAIPTIT